MVSSGMLRRVALVRTEVPPKRRFLQEPCGVISQKTPFYHMMLLISLKSSVDSFLPDPSQATLATFISPDSKQQTQ
jgi:hypothetical protein